MAERAQATIADPVGHTPGPWAAGRSHGRGVLCVTADDGCTWICGELLNEHEPIKGTEAEANANFLRGRLFFHHVDGRRAVANAGAPSVLIAYSAADAERLRASGISGRYVAATVPVDEARSAA